MITTARIVSYDGTSLIIKPDESIDRELLQKNVECLEIRLKDGREISNKQRRKVFAIIRDIAKWSGHDPEYIRQFMTWEYVEHCEGEWFSLSDVDMTTARHFITHLIEFCFMHSVPTRKSLLEETDDISRYLYLCLEHRKCAICNAPAEVHHVDRIGMGRNRNTISHLGMRAIALCRQHHDQTETGEAEMFALYHVYGIPLDEYLCKKLHLRR